MCIYIICIISSFYFELKSNNISSFSSSSSSSSPPPETVPNLKRLEAIWNPITTTTATATSTVATGIDSLFFEFGRLYRFEFLPLGFVSRAVIGLFTSFGLPAAYYLWKNGVVFHLSSVETQATSIEVSSGTLLFRLAGQNEFNLSLRASNLSFAERTLKTAVDVIESTISGFYSTYADQIKRLLVCSHCLQQQQLRRRNTTIYNWESFLTVPKSAATATPSPPSTTYFTLEEFAKAVLSSSSYTSALLCTSNGGQVPVSLKHLAPDLALTDLPVLTDITTDVLLGKGGFGQVWKGRWRGSDVAVKELTSSDATDSEATQKFLSFQKEVAVMALLKHPNLLCLYGVMLQPLRMVLGKRRVYFLFFSF